MEFTKFETVSVRNHPQLNERWIQDRIAEDPSILGLGDVNDDVKLTPLRRFEIDPPQPAGVVTMPAFRLSFRR